MFEIGAKLIDRNGKVYEVETIEDKDFGSGSEQFFVMRPLFAYDFNPGYHMFAPVSKADALFRPVMSKDEALNLIDTFASIEPYPDVSPRERKIFFTKVISSGNRDDVCRVIRSLILFRDNRRKENKPVSDFDRKTLATLLATLNAEISVALDMKMEDVSSFITERTGLEF